MSTPKRPRGRPFKDPEKVLQQRSLRLLPADWREFDLGGGVEWLRTYLAKRRAQRLRAAVKDDKSE